MWRATAAEIYWDEIDDAAKVVEQISKLKYISRVELGGDEGTRFPFSALRVIDALGVVVFHNNEPVDQRNVAELAELRQLRKLVYVIDYSDPDEEKLLAQLQAALPKCEIVDWYDDW